MTELGRLLGVLRKGKSSLAQESEDISQQRQARLLQVPRGGGPICNSLALFSYISPIPSPAPSPRPSPIASHDVQISCSYFSTIIFWTAHHACLWVVHHSNQVKSDIRECFMPQIVEMFLSKYEASSLYLDRTSLYQLFLSSWALTFPPCTVQQAICKLHGPLRVEQTSH